MSLYRKIRHPIIYPYVPSKIQSHKNVISSLLCEYLSAYEKEEIKMTNTLSFSFRIINCIIWCNKLHKEKSNSYNNVKKWCHMSNTVHQYDLYFCIYIPFTFNIFHFTNISSFTKLWNITKIFNKSNQMIFLK